ncbi:hypothetical protein GGX14DRAFT_559100 [Mycena pura]|uniref:Uncharacterized protein n=1 Tax=Mycena pura TaxID=153505 RepID=A0AAD6VST3_9AGAR|nr:hypothetical protein GGX14DRAFT_559100 [Mycena pura]
MAGAPTIASLDQLKTALRIVASLGDGALNVPILRAIACTAIEIIDIAQTVTKNKEDAIEIAKNAAERISSLLDAFKGKFKNDIPLDLQQDIARYAEKLELVQKILRKHTGQTGIWRRVASRVPSRDEIKRCKNILNEGFQVFEASLTLKLHTRLPAMFSELQSQIVAQIQPAPPKISVQREEPDLRAYLRLILRPEASAFVPRPFTLRAGAPAFVPPPRTNLRADAPVFAPRKFTLRARAPAFVPRKFTFKLRADARIFEPRNKRTLRADAPVFVPLGRTVA